MTTTVLAINEPQKITSTYEILEPETWIGKPLPILDHIDIAEKLKTGNWLVLLYHHDCPDCQKAIPQYEQMARDMQDNEDILQIALIEVPPYDGSHGRKKSRCTFGCLSNVKEWFVTTPSVLLLAKGRVRSAWDGEAPEFDVILEAVVTNQSAG